MSALPINIRGQRTSQSTDFVAFSPSPPHPGEVLREEFLPRLAITEKELARHLRLPQETLRSLIVEACSVDLDMARRLGRAFGTGPRYWLALQMHYDVFVAEQSSDVDVAPICAKGETRKARLEARKRPTMAMAVASALGK